MGYLLASIPSEDMIPFMFIIVMPILIGVGAIIYGILKAKKQGSKPKTITTQTTVKDRYDAYVQSKARYICKETTARNPIEIDDPNYEEKTAELEEYTKIFLNTLSFPQGFSEYINNRDDNWTKRYIIKNRGMYGDYFEVYDILELEKIKEFTLDYMLGDDYHTQFRDLVVFAFADGGHGAFMLDYGQSKSTPSVKFLDNEVDIVEHVADSFEEFLANLVDEEDAALKAILEKEDEIISGMIASTQSQNESCVEVDKGGFDDKEYDRLNAEAAYNYDTNKRCFIFKDEKSDKFWCVNHIDNYYYVHYGKNGTFGRIEVKEAENEDACRKFVEKTIAEKLGKGYAEINGAVADDEFEKAKSGCRPALDSMYFMFHEDEPLIYIAAIKAACEQFCDIMRLASGNKEKIINAVKAVVLCLNQYAEDPGMIETEEREILGPWTDEIAALAGYKNPDDLAGEWREW